MTESIQLANRFNTGRLQNSRPMQSTIQHHLLTRDTHLPLPRLHRTTRYKFCDANVGGMLWYGGGGPFHLGHSVLVFLYPSVRLCAVCGSLYNHTMAEQMNAVSHDFVDANADVNDVSSSEEDDSSSDDLNLDIEVIHDDPKNAEVAVG